MQQHTESVRHYSGELTTPSETPPPTRGMHTSDPTLTKYEPRQQGSSVASKMSALSFNSRMPMAAQTVKRNNSQQSITSQDKHVGLYTKLEFTSVCILLYRNISSIAQKLLSDWVFIIVVNIISAMSDHLLESHRIIMTNTRTRRTRFLQATRPSGSLHISLECNLPHSFTSSNHCLDGFLLISFFLLFLPTSPCKMCCNILHENYVHTIFYCTFVIALPLNCG